MPNDDPVLSQLALLRDAVATLNINLAVNTEANKGLKLTLDRLQASAVTKSEHQGVVDDVVELKTLVKTLATKDDLKDVRAGIERNDLRWNRVLWGIAAAVGLAVLGLVVRGNAWTSSASHAGSTPSSSLYSSAW